MFMFFNKRIIITETDNVDGPESYVDEEKNRLCVTWQLRIGSSRLFSAAHPSGPEIHIAMPLQPAAPIFKKISPCYRVASPPLPSAAAAPVAEESQCQEPAWNFCNICNIYDQFFGDLVYFLENFV